MAEVFEEIENEVINVIEETTEEINITTDASVIEEDVINLSTLQEDVLDEVKIEGFNEVLEDQIGPEIQGQVEKTMDQVVSNEQLEVGTMTEDLPPSASAVVPKTTAEQNAVRDAVANNGGLWKKMKTGMKMVKIGAEIFIIGEFIGRAIYETFMAIQDAESLPSWAETLTEAQKKQLTNIEGTTSQLAYILKGWHSAIAELCKNTSCNYGTLSVPHGGKMKTVAVIDVVSYLVKDAYQQLGDVKKAIEENQNPPDYFTEVENKVFNAFADMQALIDLRINKDKNVRNDRLELYNFPPKEDDAKVQKILRENFPSWKQHIRDQGLTLAKMEGAKAVGFFLNAAIIMKVNTYMADKVFPQVRNEAKIAGNHAAQDYVASKRGKIILKALIPIVGSEKAREYGRKIKREAIQIAKDAANRAGQRKANQLKGTIKEDLKQIMTHEIQKDKDTMAQIGKLAAEDILEIIIPPVQVHQLNPLITRKN